MKKIIFILIGALPLFFSCVDLTEVTIPIPDDITFNELTLAQRTHNVPDNGFTSKGVTFNTKKNPDGSYSGFAYSNQNNRSFVWSDSPAARDTNIFSVFTTERNLTEIFAVVHADVEAETYFSIPQPTVVEHILVANTTYNYMAMYYGPKSSNATFTNPNIPSAPKGQWYTYVPGVTKTLSATGEYYKIVAKGYNGNTLTDTLDIYLVTRKADPKNPTFNYLTSTWIKADLTSLGAVTKVTFSIMCSYKGTNGKSIYPPYFCIDGIRLKK